MKKVLIVLSVVFVVLVAAVFTLPIIFKDDIKTAIDRELAKSVNADIYFDPDHFNLTLFSNFPNLTAELNYFGIINKAPFEGEPLLGVERLEIEVNLASVLFGDGIRIKGVTLDHPEVFIKVLADGTANYDIAIPSDSVVVADTATTESSGDFSIGVDHWEIINGHVVYDDASLPFKAEVKGLNHTGSGDFSLDIIDVDTYTKVDSLSINYDGIEYMSGKQADIAMKLTISDDYSKYTFKENLVKVNDFGIGFDGFFALEESGYPMDIQFKAKETDFKGLLSLVPGVFTADFKDLKTDGSLAFDGFVRGTFNDLGLPAFNVALKVSDAMFQFDGLPTAISNINIDMVTDNKDGVIENTAIDIKQLHADFGKNPLDAKVLIENLRDFKMDADINAKLNLAELNQMFPMPGLDMRGTYSLNLKANGIYDSLKQLIPAIDASMALEKGYLKSAEFPLPMEDVHFGAKIKNASGKIPDTRVTVNDFTMVMEKEKFSADLVLENLDNIAWDLKAKGGIDLEKITKVFPLEGMQLKGKIKADFSTKGKMSDLEAERYANLPTSGAMSVSNFEYKDKSLPYDVSIASAKASFDPKSMNLEQFKGQVGKSDMEANGSITNYIGYLFGKNQVLKGVLDFRSNMLDLNEFMVEEESGEGEAPAEQQGTPPQEGEAIGAIPIPENIDFTLKSDIKTVKMMDWVLYNVQGNIVAKDGIARMQDVRFNMLDGAFAVNGSYNAKDIKHPMYDLDLNIQNLSIQESYKAFVTVKKFAPIAQFLEGTVNTNFKIAGELDDHMMPNLNTVNGTGLFEIAKAVVKDNGKSKLISGLANQANLNNKTLVNIKETAMSMKLENGKLKSDPFEVEYGGMKAMVDGSTSLDGSIDYRWKMDMPASKVGSLGKQYNQLAGKDPNSPVPVTIRFGGSFLNPKIKLDLSDAKAEVDNQVKKETDKAKAKIKNDVTEGVNKFFEDKRKKDEEGMDSTAIAQKRAKEEQGRKDAEEAINKIKGLFKKKN